MKKTMTVGVIAVASTLILTGCGQIQPATQDMIPADAMVKEDSKMVDPGQNAMMKADTGSTVKTGETMMPKPPKPGIPESSGMYATYSSTEVEKALKDGKKVALFFHATWCPSCKSADAKLSQETFPADTVVFKTDYDTNTELRKKYGVTSQHTFVSLKSDGMMMKKASGLSSASEIAELF